MKLMLWLWWPQPWDHTENCNKLFRLICEKKILVGFCLFLILLGGGLPVFLLDRILLSYQG